MQPETKGKIWIPNALRGLILLVLSQLYLSGESQTVNWVKRTWGGQNNNTTRLSVDEHGNSYVTGLYHGAYPERHNFVLDSGGAQLFAAKLDANGDLLWAANSFSKGQRPHPPAASTVKYDSKGNLVIAGYFYNYIRFGEIELTTSSRSEIFVVKYDTKGEVLWAKQFGENHQSEFCYELVVDRNDQIYLSGTFSQIFSLDGITLDPEGGYNQFVVKLDSEGKVLWAEKGRATSYPRLRVSVSGELFVSGEFQNYLWWGKSDSIITGGGVDRYIARFDAQGDLSWITTMTGKKYEYLYDYKLDKQGNIYGVGQVGDSSRIAGQLVRGVKNQRDAVFFKLNSSGELLWSTIYGNDTSYFGASKLIWDYQGKLLVFGEEGKYMDSTNNFSYVRYGLRKLELDSETGSISLSHLYSNLPSANSIESDTHGNLYFYGAFQVQVPFGNAILHAKTNWYERYLGSVNLFEQPSNLGNFKIFPNPSDGFIHIRSGPNVLGLVKYQMYDLKGKVVHESHLSPGETLLNTAELTLGTYILRISSLNAQEIFKVMLK